jgi:hypothetical protein
MNEAGPFDTKDPEHMRLLAEYIGWFCRRITTDIEEASASTSQT